jgi:hypothetical protein
VADPTQRKKSLNIYKGDARRFLHRIIVMFSCSAAIEPLDFPLAASSSASNCYGKSLPNGDQQGEVEAKWEEVKEPCCREPKMYNRL